MELMLGAILFLVFFLMIAPASRDAIFGMFLHAKDWIILWAPYSYALVLLVILAPIAAHQVLVHWPAPVEPENPMARYKREAETLDQD